MQLSEKQYIAADLFIGLVRREFSVEPALQSETIIVSSARLAGSLLLRSFKLKIDDIQPGTAILSDEANSKGPELINILAAFLQVFQVSLNEEKLKENDFEIDKIRLTALESIKKLQNDALLIMKEKDLNFEEAAQSVAMATALFIRDYAPSIGGETGFRIAVYGFIEGSKTVPPPFNGVQGQSNRKPWYKFW